MSRVRLLELDSLDEPTLDSLLRRRPWDDPAVIEGARAIVDDVRSRGDAALVERTARHDGVRLAVEDLTVSDAESDAAADAVAPPLRAAIDRALDNVRRVHERQRPAPFEAVETEPGVWCGERWLPYDSAALYVPRGRGAFSSVAVMVGVPAIVAGVRDLTLLTPPGPDGSVDAATLYVARRLGIGRVVRVGGAQAVAAAAFGTETVPRCDAILGPGNVWVAAARRLLADTIDPGPPAGPSESLVVADRTADPDNAAWNLLIEAEHGENSAAVLVTDDADVARRVVAAVERFMERLTDRRREYASIVLSRRGGVVLASDRDAMLGFANRFAAEHVALMVADPWDAVGKLRHAGEILLGDTPVISVANYVMGVNAILPTGGAARTRSPLSVRDYGKYTSVAWMSRDGFRAVRDAVPPFSRDEGFSAHHEAVLAWRDTEGGGS